MRRLFTVLIVAGLALVASIFGGPVLSGAVLLLLPTGVEAEDHDLPESYQPLHKGGVDLATGLYVREDEDLVVRGTPALILRRSYLSGYRVSKQFGVGATHNGEIYLHGDLRQISLILATGSRITFDRTSPGSLHMNAMFVHRSNSEWDGAQLGWAGLGWVLKRPDGELSLFRGCGEGSVCSVIQSRDSDGHTIRYVRDQAGRLARMQSGDRWIVFAYDTENRITEARASSRSSVAYEYDSRGRLTRVTASDGLSIRYGYTDADEMASIEEPTRTIKTRYDTDGRCIRQDVRHVGSPAVMTYTFDYRLDQNAIVETEMHRSDGYWNRQAFNVRRSLVSESWGASGTHEGEVTYDRDPDSDWPTGLTVTCPDRKGIPLRHIGFVSDGNAERVLTNLYGTHCFWPKRSPSSGPE